MRFRLLLLPLLLLVSCGCPELTTGPVQDPRVYNQTITEFNAGWIPAADPNDRGDRGTPVPRFSIGTFEFPITSTSSGSFPNDSRFEEGRGLVYDIESLRDGSGRLAQLVSRAPGNNAMEGDIMVVSVDPTSTPRTARLRFTGRLYRFPDTLASGSATAFIDYIRLHARTTEQLDDLRGSASRFGAGLTSAERGALDTIVVDSLGREIAGVTVPSGVLGELSTSEVLVSYEVTVEVGVVFYYVAANGVEFAVHIEDIFEGTLPPNQRRVTIKFAALHGPELCQPM